MLTVCALTEEAVISRDAKTEKLIAKMSCGEVSAMGPLYELIGTDIYAYALSKTASKEDAEDITQDTFVQIWKSAKQYKPQGKPLAWIFTIEMNLIRRQYRKKQRFVSLDKTPEIESDGGAFAENIINSEFLRQILRLLTEEEREIITLHIVSGLKHREIAKLLDKPLSTVLSKYNRAMKRLQAQIKEKEE
ncbi:MAG: RNA polymerase sigma factor [Clostridia bacterium]|nr:RNA polymerase sigma factor [Clostridia bacterium]